MKNREFKCAPSQRSALLSLSLNTVDCIETATSIELIDAVFVFTEWFLSLKEIPLKRSAGFMDREFQAAHSYSPHPAFSSQSSLSSEPPSPSRPALSSSLSQGTTNSQHHHRLFTLAPIGKFSSELCVTMQERESRTANGDSSTRWRVNVRPLDASFSVWAPSVSHHLVNELANDQLWQYLESQWLRFFPLFSHVGVGKRVDRTTGRAEVCNKFRKVIENDNPSGPLPRYDEYVSRTIERNVTACRRIGDDAARHLSSVKRKQADLDLGQGDAWDRSGFT